MATLLHRLGKTAYRRWPFFIAGWLVLLIAVITVAAGFSKPMSDAFTIPGIPSEKAADLQSELFPGSADALDEASVTVVVAAPKGHTLDEPTYSKAVDALVADLAACRRWPTDAPLANPVEAADVADAADPRRRRAERHAPVRGAGQRRRRSPRCPRTAGSAPSASPSTSTPSPTSSPRPSTP